MGGSEAVSRPAAVAGPRGPAAAPGTLRIGEAARACGVTTRTLRYWQEIGLITPSGRREGGERLYSDADVARARRIRELQDLLGFSLAEIRAVLETDDVLDRLRFAYRSSARPEVLLELLGEALEANDRLLARLDETLARVQAFRAERAEKKRRLRARARELRAALEREATPG
ncbi:MAG TPA: MerR family transcriptional regulator [Acidimicrobiales bacterium]|nr:MerR family transcriptional regulator [Acidimicrobiales bacterium]